MPPVFNAASRSSTVAPRADPAAVQAVAPVATRPVRRVVPAASRIRVRLANSQAVLVPSIRLVPVLPALAPAVRAARVHVPALALAPVASRVVLALVALERVQVVRHLRVKRRAHHVLPGRQEAVDVSSIRRPKKAR